MVPQEYLIKRVWNSGATDEIELSVAVTRWIMAEDRLGFERSRSMPLRSFLDEVLSGEREWFRKEQLHDQYRSPGKRWAG